MILSCPECATNYSIAATAVPERGRTVKCAKCDHVWRVTRDELLDDTETELAGTNSSTSTTSDDSQPEPATQETDGPSPNVTPDAEPDQNHPAEPAAGATITDNLFGRSRRLLGLFKKRLIVVKGLFSSAAPTVGRPLQKFIGSGVATVRENKPKAIKTAALLLLVAGGLFAAVHWRQAVVHTFRGSAELYTAVGYPVNLRGLEFRGLEYTRSSENGLSILSISGEVTNISPRTVRVPHIRLALRNHERREIYHWSAPPPVTQLAPTESAKFVTRLAAPPVSTRSVQLRFVDPLPRAFQ